MSGERALGPTDQSQFAFAGVPGRKLNIGCGRDVRSRADGWTNLDGYFEHPDVVRHDLTRFPWPFESAAFDLAYASHVLEHIPPMFIEDKAGHKWDALDLIFEEVHRVLKPEGVFVVRVPWGLSYMGVVHPRHYRQFRPEWFYYLEPEHEEAYEARAHYRVESWARTRSIVSPRFPYALRMGAKGLPLTTHLRVRFPFLRFLLEKPAELVVRLRKA